MSKNDIEFYYLNEDKRVIRRIGHRVIRAEETNLNLPIYLASLENKYVFFTINGFILRSVEKKPILSYMLIVEDMYERIWKLSSINNEKLIDKIKNKKDNQQRFKRIYNLDFY